MTTILPSWNETPARQMIIDFVTQVTTEGHATFVPPAERIAVFDNDGTLWPENPAPFQLLFVLDEIKRLAPQLPEWKENATIQAALTADIAALKEQGKHAAMELLAATHAGITTDDFNDRVRNWLRTATHPRFQRPYVELAYAPMLEVLDYLRANNFQTWIVSGGGADFMRVFAEETYGIPPERVVGSFGPVHYEIREGVPVLLKDVGMPFVDDKEGKPVGIHRQIGRRPIACFGNSDGDKAMMEWTTMGPRRGLGVLIHHTDAEREYAYDAAPKSSGKLIEALADAPQRGWTVVDMQNDFAQIFRER